MWKITKQDMLPRSTEKMPSAQVEVKGLPFFHKRFTMQAHGVAIGLAGLMLVAAVFHWVENPPSPLETPARTSS